MKVCERSQQMGLDNSADDNDTVAVKQLRNLVDRIERLEAERSDLSTDIREIYTEAAACGFDKKALREIIKLRKLEQEVRIQQQEMVNLYKQALDMD